MSAPAWQRLAEAGYSLLLELYPRHVRERHGEEMRQAFRDRCREVSAGRISAWRLLCLELAPDFATSFAGAHMQQPSTPRMRASLLALGALGLLWLLQGVLSPLLLDGFFALRLQWEHWREERAFAHDEARVRELAGTLAASRSPLARSQAAYLYAINHVNRSRYATYAIGAARNIPFEPVAEDGERAARTLASVPLLAQAETARLALAACQLVTGCDGLARAQALARIEPRNAYAWSQLLALHSQAGDEAAVRSDLARLAQSSYYEHGLRETERAFVALALQAAPGDAGTIGALGRQLSRADAMVTDDFRHSLFFRCALTPSGGSNDPRWLERHPDARADCRSAATVIANSKTGWESSWGWRWLDRDQPTERTRAGLAQAQARLQRSLDFGGARTGARFWRPWTDAEWLDWARTQASSPDRT